MNLVQKWLQNGGSYEEGALLYKKYGHNKELKEVFEKGYAVFDINAALRRELENIKDLSWIPDVETIVGNAIPSETQLKKIAKIEERFTSVDALVNRQLPEFEQLENQLATLFVERNKRANILTSESVSGQYAKELVMECKRINQDVVDTRAKINYLLKNGELKKEATPEAELVETLEAEEDLKDERKKSNSRKFKYKRSLKNNPERRIYYEAKIKKEEDLVEQINIKLQDVRNKQ